MNPLRSTGAAKRQVVTSGGGGMVVNERKSAVTLLTEGRGSSGRLMRRALGW
jgi:hypothetical protein